MEAVPRLPMVSFHLKVSPEPTSFSPKLKQYIRDFYHEDPESYANEIHQLEGLRAMAVRPPIDVAGCALLKKYYCQLHFLQSRFPMAKDGAAAVTFTWRDTYANMVCSLANIRFEIISILYNVGAMHTQLGARTERTTAEGMKMACAHFQCAAWAFEHLKISYPQPPGVDLAPELMTFMHQLCLAQAQECILEKSMLDNRKPTIVAKVARQIVDYYSLALNTLEQGGSEDGSVSDTVGAKIYKSWKRYVKFKRAYHLAVAQLYQGLAAEEQQKMGERVAFYNASVAALNEARTLYGNTKGGAGGLMSGSGSNGGTEEKEAVEEALTFTNDVIEGKRKAAKNENEFIYHEEVPEKDVLPTVKGASLVKGIPFNVNDPEVSGPDIFARLVPMKVHEASSLYSEEKAKILRSVGTKVEERDQQLITYLASLRLEHLSLWDPDSRDAEGNYLAIPEELVERCAALNAKPSAIQDLVDAMGKLADTYQDVEAMLKEIEHLLAEEQTKEKRYQEVMGKRPPSIVATDLTREAKKYEEAHAKASESNQALHRAMTLHVNNLRILARPLADLMAHIPSLPTGRSDGREKDDASIANTRELSRILGKVDDMRRQRSELHAQLRDAVTQDDLTRLLVTATADSGSLDRLFAEQISKHQKLVSLIEQNLTAQDNVLAALTEAYARTADTRKAVDETMKRREVTITSLISSYDAYEDLLAKSSKGLEFYRKLETNVSKLLQRVKSTCKVQEEEREQILARNNKTTVKIGEPTFPENTDDEVVSSAGSGGGGLKLKDYLANRQKGVIPQPTAVSSYQNPYYNSHVSQSGASQQPVPVPSVRPAPVGQEGNDLPPASSDSSLDPKTHYQRHPGGYTSYYTGQRTNFNPQYLYGQYSDFTYGLSASLPKSSTTNTASTYHQAGGLTETSEVTSFGDQYVGYQIPQNSQGIYSPSGLNGQGQYSVAASAQSHYNQSDMYAQQASYAATGGQNSGYPISQNHNNQGNYGASVGYGYGAHSQNIDPGAATQYVTNYEEKKPVSNSSAVSGQNHAQPQNQPVPLQSVPNAYPSPAPSPQNWQLGTQSAQQYTPGQMQQHIPTISQQPSSHSLQTQNQQYQNLQEPAAGQQVPPHNPNIPYPAPQNLVPQDPAHSQQTPVSATQNAPAAMQYASTPQYLQSQYSSVDPNDPVLQQYSTYSNAGARVNTSSPSYGTNQGPNDSHQQNQQRYYTSVLPEQQQQLDMNTKYYPVKQTSSNDSSTMQSQQNYTNSNTAMVVQPNGPSNQSSQNTTHEVHQNYNSSAQQNYGSYQQNLTNVQYQQPTATQSYAQGTYSDSSELIHSHAKSTAVQNYSQNYGYSAQGQYPGTSSYQQGYGQQGYTNSYTPVSQVGGTSNLTDSYQGHPGYAYDPSIGGYQYSSGYQDSRNSRSTGSGAVNNEEQVTTVPQQSSGYNDYQRVESSSYTTYTNASNNVSTHHTPSSQYAQQSYQTPEHNQAYYTMQYGLQGQGSTPGTGSQNGTGQTYMQATNNQTSTTASPSTDKPEVNATEPKSNVDLLADLEVSINHAPLVPEVNTLSRTEKDDESSNKPSEKNSTTVKQEVKEIDVPIKVEEIQTEMTWRCEEKHENLQIVWDTWYTDVQPKQDPLGDAQVLQKFAHDVEKYEKFVDGLLTKTLSGATTLDIKWKEVRDFQERETQKQTTKAALTHPDKNRMTDSLPYDSSRVEISSPEDEHYINASHVKDVTQWTPAAFIVTQAPIPGTFKAFWTMIWEQGSEVIACLATDSQLNGDSYWPATSERDLNIGDFVLSLKNSVNHTCYLERIISISRSDSKASRTVVHIQFTEWPSNGFPNSPGPLLTFATDALSEQALRRCSPKPIVVHCLNGSALSGLFLLAAAAVCHVRAGRGLVDAALVFSTLVKFRRSLVDKDSLLFAYRMILYHAQDTLMKRGVLSSSRSSFDYFEGLKGSESRGRVRKTQQRHPSEDFLRNLGVNPGRLNQHDFPPGGTIAPGMESSAVPSTDARDKLEDAKPVDPLSQLDPMWSIRK